MGNPIDGAHAALDGGPLQYEECLVRMGELEKLAQFELACRVAERSLPAFTREQSELVQAMCVRLAKQQISQLLLGPLTIAQLEAPFAMLNKYGDPAARWPSARNIVQRLRTQARPGSEVDAQRWKDRLRNAISDLGACAAEDASVLSPDLRVDLIKDLKAHLAFGTARQIIERTTEALALKQREWFQQQLALCTYKDEELIPRERFRTALQMLDHLKDIVPDESPETLSLRGAVYKRMWEYSGQTENLYTAAMHYLAAWDKAPAEGKGYPGINAAYLMDVLSNLEKPILRGPGAQVLGKEDWKARARNLREELKKAIPDVAQAGASCDYWGRVTNAEILWGLEDWAAAAEWLALARRAEACDWELQTTVKQLVSLARLRGVTPPPEDSPEAQWHAAWQALARLTGADTRSVLTCSRGKVGLALSGGGFRASLFHLGVLARLAEMDVLRSVEVLSTVSGGSIVGAHYYLEVRNALCSEPDAQLTREHYVRIVQRIQDDFLDGIRNNLRMRGLSNLLCNLRFVAGGAYTRSNRMGELYEEFLYSRVQDGHPGETPRVLQNLLIRPRVHSAGGAASSDERFNPKFSNWRRRAKVPILLLNATSLNTGHNWHFTARSMGEPPGLLGPEAETIPRYRRLWYDEAPNEELKRYRLGYAVAASACVPTLFEPLELKGLYPGRTVRLVDGGVHDNQGVAGLLDESCTLVLCSDASGQMRDMRAPSNSLLGVPLRSNTILSDRVRESQYLDLRSRLDSCALQGLFFIHLRQELGQDPITWIGGKGKEPAERSTETSYHVDRQLQDLLAGVRTDLDAFSEVEAYSLMASGYLMTKREFERLDEQYRNKGGSGTWGDFDIAAPTREQQWKFLEIAPLLRLAPSSSDLRREDLERQLRVASSRFLKAFKLCPKLSVIGGAVLALVAAALLYLTYRNWDTHIDLRVGGLVLAGLLLAGGFVWRWIRLADPQAVIRSWLFKLGLAASGWALTNFHVRVIDPIFLKRGSWERLKRLFEK